MKIMLLKSFLLVGALMCFGLAGAQTVSGNISDANGPLPGATVVVKGTATGTTADFDGNYSIEAGSGDVLVFSFVGYNAKEVAVGNQDTINVVLEAANELEEVIIVGYGTTTKQDATGAVEAIGADDISTVSAINPAEALRGKVAGVQISQTTGEPGAGLSIRVRGSSSIRSGNDPLIVVDGIPLAGGSVSAGGADFGLGGSTPKSPLNFVNQEDIESITVLKDASSTAIYGSRGANGVVIITTKGGRSGDAKFDFSSNVSFSSLRNDIGMMTASQFEAQKAALGYSLLKTFGGNYDWKNAILRDAVSKNYNLGITFGGGNSTNRISMGYQDAKGIVKKTGMNKLSFNFDNKTSLSDNISLNTKVNVSQVNDQAQMTSADAGFVGNVIGAALYWNPTRDVLNGSEYSYESSSYLNPAELIEKYNDETATTRILASVNPKIQLSDKLDFNMVLGVDYSTSRRGTSLEPSMQIQDLSTEDYGGFASINDFVRSNKTFENYLTYKTEINDDININALLGYSYYDYQQHGSFTAAERFSPSQINTIDNIEGADPNYITASSFRSRNELQSFYSRIESQLYDNLLVTASVRMDGSTRTGKNNKYGIFPALGVAYKLYDNAEGSINNLKFRGNYGQTGNQEFSNNSALSVGQYVNGAIEQTSNVNADLNWETTTTYGAGIDFTLLDYKLSGSVDVFQKETRDLIFPTDPASSAPGAAVTKYVNLDGMLVNQGLEVSLNYNVVEADDLSFSIGANAAYIQNEMKDFANQELTGNLHGQGLTGATSQIITNGESIFTYYLKDWAGFDSIGMSSYYKADGSITGLAEAPTLILSGKSGLPNLNVGFNTNLTYKNFDFSTSWYGQFGHYIYNNTANAYFYTALFKGGRNIPFAIANSGQNSSDVAAPSTYFLEKGDFIRLGNVSLGYNFANLDSKSIDSMRIFVNASNLLTITNYSGFDPEVSVLKYNSNGVPGAGIDYIGYPNSKTIAIGLNVKF